MADNTVTFAGVKAFKQDLSVHKEWDEIEYGDEKFYMTKKEFEHIEQCEECVDNKRPTSYICSDENCLNYKYRYIIRETDLYNITMDDQYEDKYEVTLYMVVSPESLCNERKEEVNSSMDRVDYISIVEYGTCSIMLGNEVISEEALERNVLAAKEAVRLIDSMRGFYLDRAVNRLGTDGWHIIRYALGKVDRPF